MMNFLKNLFYEKPRKFEYHCRLCYKLTDNTIWIYDDPKELSGTGHTALCEECMQKYDVTTSLYYFREKRVWQEDEWEKLKQKLLALKGIEYTPQLNSKYVVRWDWVPNDD